MNNSPKKILKPLKKNLKHKFLEIYIEDDGNLIITPLKNNLLTVFQPISGSNKVDNSFLCG